MRSEGCVGKGPAPDVFSVLNEDLSVLAHERDAVRIVEGWLKESIFIFSISWHI